MKVIADLLRASARSHVTRRSWVLLSWAQDTRWFLLNSGFDKSGDYGAARGGGLIPNETLREAACLSDSDGDGDNVSCVDCMFPNRLLPFQEFCSGGGGGGGLAEFSSSSIFVRDHP